MPDAPKGAVTGSSGMVFSTARSRVAQLGPKDFIPESPPVTFSESDASLTKYRTAGGIDNPYGTGLSAYEPHTVIFDGYKDAYNRVQGSKAAEAAAAQSFTDVPAAPGQTGSGGPTFQSDGKVSSFVSAAMSSLGKPYVWGGTNLATGTDCSGLIYAAARAAGIENFPRYRAADLGQLGAEVAIGDARPGDIVYYDEPGDTDHVGIYLGNGRMLQSPQSGDVTKISTVGNFTSIRRVFDDSAFAQTANPPGSSGFSWSYNGTTYQPWRSAGSSVAANTRNPTAPNTINRHRQYEF